VKKRNPTIALVSAFLVLSLTAGEIAAQDRMARIGKWFKIRAAALKHWKVTAHLDDPLRVTLTAKPGVYSGTTGFKKVMVMYPRKSTAYDIAMTEIAATYANKGIRVQFEVVNFDRKSPRGHALVDEAAKKGYSLIYSMGSQTTAWLWKNRRDGKVPIVTVCSKDPVQLGQMKDYKSGSGVNFAFTSLNVLVDVQIAYLRQLKPKLKNVVIMVDEKNISAVKTQAIPMERALKAEGINVFRVSVTDPKDAKAQLEELVPKAVERLRKTDPDLKNSLFWVTGSTSVFVEIKTINEHAGKVPVLSVVPEIVQKGPDSATLGMGVSFQSNAQLAAKIGADILAGKAKARDLKVAVVSPPNIAISFLRARKIGLKIPFSLFEAADDIYGYDGQPLRRRGQTVN